MKHLNLIILLMTLPVMFLFGQKPTYVFVHGAWGGGWQFKNTANRLTEAGATVYRVNLTGLGDRVHLANPSVNLTTHIKDVVNTLLFERLDSFILVGHSYGGMVITGVADSLPDRIQKVVYLDAFVPEDGESVSDYVKGTPAEMILKSDDGISVIPGWVRDTTVFPRDVPHPLASLTERIRLRNPDRLKLPTTYILTSEVLKGGKEKDEFYFFSTRAKKYNWKVLEMEADHNPQIKELDALVKLLLNEK